MSNYGMALIGASRPAEAAHSLTEALLLAGQTGLVRDGMETLMRIGVLLNTESDSRDRAAFLYGVWSSG